jgi:hypothetical protein
MNWLLKKKKQTYILARNLTDFNVLYETVTSRAFELYWGKDADQVIYGRLEQNENGDTYVELCPICDSRIDEFGYCACGGNLGVS